MHLIAFLIFVRATSGADLQKKAAALDQSRCALSKTISIVICRVTVSLHSQEILGNKMLTVKMDSNLVS